MTTAKNKVTETVTLDDPIENGSETITQIILRKPKAKDLRGFPLKMGFDEMLTLAGRVSGHPDSVIGELSVPDLNAVVEVLGNFIGASRKIGKTA